MSSIKTQFGTRWLHKKYLLSKLMAEQNIYIVRTYTLSRVVCTVDMASLSVLPYGTTIQHLTELRQSHRWVKKTTN